MVDRLFLTVEQSEHLQSLGLDMSDAEFCWVRLFGNASHTLLDRSKLCDSIVYDRLSETPTYCLQEIIPKMPRYFCMSLRNDNMLLDAYNALVSYLEVKDKPLEGKEEPRYGSAMVFDDIDGEDSNYTVIKKKE